MNIKQKKSLGIIVFILGIGFFYYLLSGSDGLINKLKKGSDQIAIVEIEGPIISSEHTLRLLRHYQKMDNVKALVLRINSPGGQVGSVQEIYEELKKTRRSGKKIVASFGDIAASGGYYIACGADKIVSNPGALTGSIGVIMQFTNFEELVKKIGVDFMVIKSGIHKDIGSPVRKMTEEEKVLLKDLVDDVYEQFVEAVAESRNLKTEEVRKYADGRVFSGRQAKAYGLIDSLGGIQEAIEYAKVLAKIPGEPRVIIEKKPFPDLWSSLIGMFRGKIEGYKNSSPSILYQM